MEDIVKLFIEHGILGVVALLSFAFGWRMYRDGKALRSEMTDKLEEQHRIHREELKAYVERYITKADTWTEKNYELTKEITQVTSLLERRWGKD